MGKFTVIGFHAQNAQVFAEHVEANNRTHAFFVCASKPEYEDAEFLCAIDGFVKERSTIDFVGSALVDTDTIIEQPDVFC